MMRRTAGRAALAAALAVAALDAAAQISVDPAIPAYTPAAGISGSLSSCGSDTMNNMMTLWGEKFKTCHPSVTIGVEGKGSGTAVPALIAGTAQLGPMSRAMKETEIDKFESKFGYKPTAIRTSVDALAVFVNKDNPVKSLSFAQLDALYSKSRRRGGSAVRTWGDLGLTGEWASKPVSLYGRNSASGTYGFFREHVMQNGDYRDEVKEQPGSASVVLSVTEDRYGIGYSGIGYATAGVRAVPLCEKDGGTPAEATAANAYSGAYPLARYLFIIVNRDPGKSMDPLTREFVRLVLSKEGQEIVIKDGYFPVPAAVASEERGKIGPTIP
jgi:phosphate transport system substrate-binding protein